MRREHRQPKQYNSRVSRGQEPLRAHVGWGSGHGCHRERACRKQAHPGCRMLTSRIKSCDQKLWTEMLITEWRLDLTLVNFLFSTSTMMTPDSTCSIWTTVMDLQRLLTLPGYSQWRRKYHEEDKGWSLLDYICLSDLWFAHIVTFPLPSSPEELSLHLKYLLS